MSCAHLPLLSPVEPSVSGSRYHPIVAHRSHTCGLASTSSPRCQAQVALPTALHLPATDHAITFLLRIERLAYAIRIKDQRIAWLQGQLGTFKLQSRLETQCCAKIFDRPQWRATRRQQHWTTMATVGQRQPP